MFRKFAEHTKRTETLIPNFEFNYILLQHGARQLVHGKIRRQNFQLELILF